MCGEKNIRIRDKADQRAADQRAAGQQVSGTAGSLEDARNKK